MEYCLSILYVAMDELGMIWCMDAFMERRYKDWKFWGVFAVNLGVSFYLFNFVVSGITVLHTLIAYAVFFILAFLLFKATNITLLATKLAKGNKNVRNRIGHRIELARFNG